MRELIHKKNDLLRSLSLVVYVALFVYAQFDALEL